MNRITKLIFTVLFFLKNYYGQGGTLSK